MRVNKTAFSSHIHSVKQEDHNIQEIGIHELAIHIELCPFKLHDVCSYNSFNFIRFTMNDRPKLIEEFYEPHLSL